MSARFKIDGVVKKMHVTDSRKVSFLTVSSTKTKADGTAININFDMKYFGDASKCVMGGFYSFRGDIGNEPVKDGQENIKVRGYEVWRPSLVVDGIYNAEESDVEENDDSCPF